MEGKRFTLIDKFPYSDEYGSYDETEWQEHKTATGFIYDQAKEWVTNLKLEELDFLEGMTFNTFENGIDRFCEFISVSVLTNRLKAEAPTHPRIKEFEDHITKLMLEEFIEGGIETAKAKQLGSLKKTGYGL